MSVLKSLQHCRRLGSTDIPLSVLGLGGSGYGDVYGKHDKKQSISAVRYALDRNINYIDTGYWYGQGSSETFLGEALRGVQRDKFFIATKVCRYEQDVKRMFDFSAGSVVENAEKSLRRLQLDHVDLLQIHDVEFAPSVEFLVNNTLPALHRLQQRGLCRYVGITGYPLQTLKDVVVGCEKNSLRLDTVLSYARLTLHDSSLIKDFEFYKSRGIAVINACALGMGLLTTHCTLQDWHPAGVELKTACSKAARYCLEHGVDLARLAVNYSANFSEVTTTLVSMMDKTTVERNIEAICNPLTDKEQQVKEYIIQNFFEPLEHKDWENKEVIDYWNEMKKYSQDATCTNNVCSV